MLPYQQLMTVLITWALKIQALGGVQVGCRARGVLLIEVML
jgi:hypothetical protein